MLGFLFRQLHSPDLTSNFSFLYLCVFLPGVLLLYGISPRKIKPWLLLAASFCFSVLISGKRVVYLLMTTVTVYGLGLVLEALNEKCAAEVKAAEKAERKQIKKRYAAKQRMVTALGVAVNIGALLVLKYSGFFAENANGVLHLLGVGAQLPVPKFLMPIGISFYTLQALSYLLDISRGVIHADRHPGRVALFVSFFPAIVEGPICRYSQTAQQLWEGRPIRERNLRLGSQRILYGLMKKLVVADRLNAFVSNVFGDYGSYSGGIIAMAAVAYTIQLYMDFSGAMDGALGTAQIIGLELPENFRRPFFSKTISEFWSRWHITLGTWFKDFIFYPVTMSKKMKNLTGWGRKKLGNHFGPLMASAVALFCVWLSNGLWHGSAWNYIFFGMYHFALILLGSTISPWSAKLRTRLHVEKETRWYAALQTLRTALLVVVGELFFRAEGLANGFGMLAKIFADPTIPEYTWEFSKKVGLQTKDIGITLVTVAIVAVVSVCNEKNICVREWLESRPRWQRWAVLYGLILYILIFGAYGIGYLPVDPMYANF